MTSLLRADRACAHLTATPTKKGSPLVEIQVLLAMDDGLDAVRLRFLAEARKAATLRAPGVVKILDVGITPDGHPFFVREETTGEMLATLLDRVGSLTTERAVDVAIAVCQALAAAHAHGLVHGELSPNVVRLPLSLDGAEDVKVSGLGISRALAMLPLDARAIESFAISAPEMLSAEREPDARADIWGVGVLLYTMLAGATPFAFESPSTVNLSVALDEPAMLAGVPDGLGDVVDACLARDPALRPESMQALASRLAPFGTQPVFAKRSSLLVVDTGPYEALVLETLVKKAASPSLAPEKTPEKTVAEAIDKTPEPTVVTSSVAPLALTVSPLLVVGPKTASSRTSRTRTIAIVAGFGVAAGILIGVATTRLAAPAPAGSGLVQAAAPPPAAAPLPPRVETPAAVVAPTALAAPAVAVTDLRTLPAPPRARGAAKTNPTPAAAPVDPLVHAAAAPAAIQPTPKADDELRRFLDDRR